MIKFNLFQFLVALNFGFFLLTISLFVYLVIHKYSSGMYERLKALRFREWGDCFAEFIVAGDSVKIAKILKDLPYSEYEIFVEFASIYLGNVKGEEFQKIVDSISKSKIYEYFCAQAGTGSIDSRIYSIYCLGLLKKIECEDVIKPNLGARNVLLRIITAQALARIKCFEMLEEILAAFNSEHLLHHYKTGEILWEFGEEGCPHFKKVLEKFRDEKIVHENLYVIGPLVEVLGRFKYSAAAPLVMDMLHYTDDDQVIQSCIEALGRMSCNEALPDVEKMLERGSPEIRISALNALFDMVAFDKIDKIKKLLEDDDWGVRYTAANVLFKMKYDLRGYMFDPSGNVSPRALRTLVHLLTEKMS